jgi:hypothetical protein
VDAATRKPVPGVSVVGRTRASRGMPEEMLPQAVTDPKGASVSWTSPPA